jgi:hypothetical protein
VGFFTGQGIALEAVFAHPSPGGEDRRILTRLVQMIDATPPGATIHATVFRLTDETVRDALLAARDRGTSVHVLANGRGAADSVGASLSMPPPEGLGEAHRWAGRPFDPTGEWSAYGAIASGPESDLHTKLVLFSATTAPDGQPRRSVSWWSSTNLSRGSGTLKSNNAIAVYDDPVLFDGFRTRLWESMWDGRHVPGNDFYNGSRGRGWFVGSPPSRTKVFCSPEQGTDLWVGRLASVVVDDGTVVDLAHARFTDARAPVAQELARIAAQGGRVRVLVGPHPDFLGQEVRRILDEAGVPLLRADIHDKLALVHSRHALSRRPRKLVLSGSHNLNYDANYRNDEILVKTFHDELYDDMRDNHFARIWAAGRPVTDEPVEVDADFSGPTPQPPAMAPITMNGSLPLITSSGSGSSGDSWEMSSSQA